MALRPVLISRPVQLKSVKNWPSHQQPTELRSLHTTRPQKSIEVLASLGTGYFLKSQWLTLPVIGKVAATVAPLAATSYLIQFKRRRTAYDPLLQRQKFIAKSAMGSVVPETTFLDGAGVEKANQLLGQLIEASKMVTPGLSDRRHKFQVMVFKDPKLWINSLENGMLLLSKDILTTLSRNELTMLFATQISHILAKHRAEGVTFCLFMQLSASIAAGCYAFFVPVLHSYPVDMAAFVISYHVLAFGAFQLKFRRLCLEADSLGLEIASKMGVTEKDAISLLEKLIQARKRLPFWSRIRTLCYYKHRMAAFRNRLTAAPVPQAK